MSTVLLGLGNPLLDISSHVDAELLAKYELKNANQILAEEKHLPLYQELAAREDVQFIAGGATQNSIRVAQWMLQQPGATAYIGCVGKDQFADTQRRVCTEAGVHVEYMVDETTPTGTCAVCIVDKDRSLVANLAAANNYKVEHLHEPHVKTLLDTAKVVYSSGFFITASSETVVTTAKHCSEHGKTYALNLAAPFICEVPPFKAVLVEALKMATFLFGNETEAATFATTEGWEATEVPEIAAKISMLAPAAEGKKALTVVITQGKLPTVVACEGKVTTFEVPPVDASEIVDTNGAGDAFVGGFLAAFIKDVDIAGCCKAGNYAASVVIKTSGTALPAECAYGW